MRALMALLAAMALSGCTATEGLGLGSGGDAPREPYYKDWRSWVDGSHTASYEVSVEDGAETLNLTIVLEPRTNGMPVPNVVVARLDLSLTDPQGTPLLEGEVDVQRRVASLVVADPAPGVYTLQVSGIGSSREVDGTRYGDAYTVSAEVVYR